MSTAPHPCCVPSDSVQGCPTVLPPPGLVTLLLSRHQTFQDVSLEGTLTLETCMMLYVSCTSKNNANK